MKPKQQFVGYAEEDDDLVRRFGTAIVVLWDQLTESDQRVILRQAGMVNDRKATVQLEQQLKAFIREHNLVERAKSAKQKSD